MRELVNKGMKASLMAVFVIAAFLIASTISSYAAMDEEEPNDEHQNANKIKMGTYVYGDVNDANGEDWFEFTAPINGTAKLIASYDKYSDGCIHTDIYGAVPREGGWLDYISLIPAETKSMTFGVKYGKTYYVKVVDMYHDNNSDYHFVVNYKIGKTTLTNVYRRDNGFRVKWNKKDKASFYQVRYTKKSTYEDYGWKKAKIVKVGKKYGAKTVKKLANKKKYYVQVRVARTISGKTYYSPWSNRKVVKTK